MDSKTIHNHFTQIRQMRQHYATSLMLKTGELLKELRYESDLKGKAFYTWITDNTGMSRSDTREHIECFTTFGGLPEELIRELKPSTLRILLPRLKGCSFDEILRRVEEFKDLSISDLKKELKGGEESGDTTSGTEACTHKTIVCKRCKREAVVVGAAGFLFQEEKPHD
jgi:hypothetical protein